MIYIYNTQTHVNFLNWLFLFRPHPPFSHYTSFHYIYIAPSYSYDIVYEDAIYMFAGIQVWSCVKRMQGVYVENDLITRKSETSSGWKLYYNNIVFQEFNFVLHCVMWKLFGINNGCRSKYFIFAYSYLFVKIRNQTPWQAQWRCLSSPTTPAPNVQTAGPAS